MPKFSKASLKQLESCDNRLQEIAHEVIKYIDHTILEGHRGKVAQNLAFDNKASKVRWPFGKHNSKPSRAMDIAPYPIDWNEKSVANMERFAYLAGFYMATAFRLGYKLRWGGDWDQDNDMRNEGFRDRPHLEIVD